MLKDVNCTVSNSDDDFIFSNSGEVENLHSFNVKFLPDSVYQKLFKSVHFDRVIKK